MSSVLTPLTFVLYSVWPVVIGIISLFYCGMCPGFPSTWCPVSLVTVSNSYIFYKHERQFRQLMLSTPGLTRSRYIRLMLISTTGIFETIPLAVVYIAHGAKFGVDPWRGWTSTHRHYSEVIRVPASIWKNDPNSVFDLELFRWSIILYAFTFFAFFGFASEARKNYCRMYASIASRIGYLTTTLHKSSHAYVLHSLCARPSHLRSNRFFSVFHQSLT